MMCFLVWFTPHTIAMTPSEMKAMGAAQHPVIGQFGVMSAKNGAINIMICLTALSYILYRRANHIVRVPWARIRQHRPCVLLFLVGMGNIMWLAIYGFYIPANVRVGLSIPQGVTTATVVIRSNSVKSIDASGFYKERPRPMGKYICPGYGRALRSGSGIYVGHGIDGVYPIGGPARLACQRINARPLSMGLYSINWVRRENGNVEYGGVLGFRLFYVLVEWSRSTFGGGVGALYVSGPSPVVQTLSREESV